MVISKPGFPPPALVTNPPRLRPLRTEVITPSEFPSIEGRSEVEGDAGFVPVRVGFFGWPAAAEEEADVTASSAVTRKKQVKGRANQARPLTVLVPDLLMSRRSNQRQLAVGPAAASRTTTFFFGGTRERERACHVF